MYTCSFPRASLHICQLCGSGNEWLMYPYQYMCIYLFLLRSVCTTAAPLDHLCALCMRVPVFSAPLWRGCLVRKTVKGWGQGGLSRNAALCIVCKNKPSGQRYLKRIYIEQLQKQASVCRLVMQLDHSESLNLIMFLGQGMKKCVFYSGPHRYLSSKGPDVDERGLQQTGFAERQVGGTQDGPNK